MSSRKIKWLLLFLVAFIAGGELFARFYLGLGSPPLWESHPTIAFLFKPNQRVHRFGNLFITNRYAMRSDDFPPQKLNPRELRILVFGDSVVNGGNLTDHSQLATTILAKHLSASLARPVVVGNASAGSWGPPNEIAYLRQFGFLDADLIILVLSSSDYDDTPTFAPLDPLIRPTEAPVSALWEGITRYLPRFFNRPAVNEAGIVPNAGEIPNKRNIRTALEAEHEFLEMTKAEGVRILVVQHWTQSELEQEKALAGHDEIQRIAVASGVPLYDDNDKLTLYAKSGRNPFRDDIHLNVNGQQALAELLEGMVNHVLPEITARAKVPIDK